MNDCLNGSLKLQMQLIAIYIRPFDKSLITIHDWYCQETILLEEDLAEQDVR